MTTKLDRRRTWTAIKVPSATVAWSPDVWHHLLQVATEVRTAFRDGGSHLERQAALVDLDKAIRRAQEAA